MNRWDAYPGTNVPYVTNTGPAYLDSRQVGADPRGRAARQRDRGRHRQRRQEPGAAGHRAAPGQLRSRHHELPEPRRTTSSASTHEQTELGFDDVRVRQAISHAIDRQSPRRLALLRPGRRDLRADRAELQVVRARRRAVQPVRPRAWRSRCSTRPAGRRARTASARRAGRSSRSRSRATTSTSRRRRRSTRRSCRCWRRSASR